MMEVRSVSVYVRTGSGREREANKSCGEAQTDGLLLK